MNKQQFRFTAPAPDWPPAEYQLPNDLESIEHGRQRQQELFPEQPDDSRAARLARLLSDTQPDVVTADALPGRGVEMYQNDTYQETSPLRTFFGSKKTRGGRIG